jgi:hypothetical protein
VRAAIEKGDPALAFAMRPNAKELRRRGEGA